MATRKIRQKVAPLLNSSSCSTWTGQHVFDLKTTFKDDIVIEKTIVTSSGASVTPQSSNNGDIIAGGATPAAVTGANLAGTGLSATVGDGTLVLNVEASQSQITTVGTIGTGTWQGTTIKTAYIGDDQVTEDKLADTLLAEIDANTAKLGVTVGISDGNVLAANDVVADDDFLRIDGTEVEGLTVAEVLTALNVEAGATADQSKSDIEGLAIQTVGAITSGSWTSTDIGVAYGGTGASNSDAWLNSRITTNNDGTLNYDATGATAVNHDNLAGFVAAEHYRWDNDVSATATINAANVPTLNQSTTGQAGTVATIAGLAPNTATTQATQPNIESIGTDGDTLTILSDQLTMSNDTADSPVIKLVNTTDDDQAGQLMFEKLRDDDAVTSGQNLGEIWFRGQDNAQNTEDYAYIISKIDVSTHGQESGKLLLGVASHNGTSRNGLSLTGGSEDSEVDATIGLGINSVVTIPGAATFGGGYGVGAVSVDMNGDLSVGGELVCDEGVQADGFNTNVTTLTAAGGTSGGSATVIGDGKTLIELAAGSYADDILVLPTATQGRSLRILNIDATAFELQRSNGAANGINGGATTAGASSTVGAWAIIDCTCIGSNHWVCTKTSSAGVQSALDPSS